MDSSSILSAQLLGIVHAKNLDALELKLKWHGFIRAEEGAIVRYEETMLLSSKHVGGTLKTNVLGLTNSIMNTSSLMPLTRLKLVERSIIRPIGEWGEELVPTLKSSTTTHLTTVLQSSNPSTNNNDSIPNMNNSPSPTIITYLEQETLQPKLNHKPILPVRVLRIGRVDVAAYGTNVVEIFQKQLGFTVEGQMQRNARVWISNDGQMVEIFQMSNRNREGRIYYVKSQSSLPDPWIVAFVVPLLEYTEARVDKVATQCAKFRPEVEFCRYPEPGGNE
jgi:hypothetical protein